jgi:hypothetical protein
MNSLKIKALLNSQLRMLSYHLKSGSSGWQSRSLGRTCSKNKTNIKKPPDWSEGFVGVAGVEIPAYSIKNQYFTI